MNLITRMPAEIEFISAPWCKRCHTLRPTVEEICRLAGAKFVYVNMDELDPDSDIAKAVTALPTMRTKLTADADWVMWVPASLEAWKEAVMNTALTAAVADSTMDF